MTKNLRYTHTEVASDDVALSDIIALSPKKTS